MALNSEQRKVARTIIRRGRQRGESAKEIKAAIETGLVESNLTNVRGGDRDSSGWRQERASSYPGKNRNDVKAAVDRFYDETSAVEHKYKRAGDLAQAVQRSAFPDRYGQRAKEAQRIIRELDTAKGRRAKGKVTTTTETTPGVDRSGERKQLIAQYLLDRRDNPTTSVVPTALALAEAKDTPAKTTTTTSRTREKTNGSKAIPGRKGAATGRRGKTIGTPHQGTHTLGNWQSDNAVDIAVKRGTPILATEDGVVRKVGGQKSEAGRFGGYNVTVDGKRDNYFYAHLSSLSVKPGQRVRRGQVIGRSGAANGVEHLHFGRERGKPQRNAR